MARSDTSYLTKYRNCSVSGSRLGKPCRTNTPLHAIFEFSREWGSKVVEDPKALGTYLRENYLFIRRTDTEVGRELPQLNTIVTTVEWNDDDMERFEEIARKLAQSFLSATDFSEKGQYVREFDLRLRQFAGVGKAHGVAALVKILLENGKAILLSGCHREVYDIWLAELVDYNPVMYNFKDNGESVLNSAVNPYITTVLANGYAITCTITITGGTCLSTNTGSTNTVTMVVNANIMPTMSIAAVPPGPICAGTCTVYGDRIEYGWVVR